MLITAVGFCLLDCAEISAQQKQNSEIEKALDDPNVVHGKVSFKSGASKIDGYLARPFSYQLFPTIETTPTY